MLSDGLTLGLGYPAGAFHRVELGTSEFLKPDTTRRQERTSSAPHTDAS